MPSLRFNPQTGPVVDRFHIHGPPRKEDAKPEPALVRLPPRSLSSRPHFKSYIDHTAIAHAICKAQGETKSEELETGLPVTTRCRFRKKELKPKSPFRQQSKLCHFSSRISFWTQRATVWPCFDILHPLASPVISSLRVFHKQRHFRVWPKICKCSETDIAAGDEPLTTHRPASFSMVESSWELATNEQN
jgi:hypothetical protein